MFPHRCTVAGRSQHQTLAFLIGNMGTGHTAPPATGTVITGVTSHATGTIVSVALTSGAWNDASAAGTFTLSAVTGTFQDREWVTIPGVAEPWMLALISGTQAPVKGALGTPTYAWSNVSTDCEFWYAQPEEAPIAVQGETTRNPLMVKIPVGVTVSPNAYRIVSTQSGYAGTFTIVNVTPAPGLYGTVHHYECQLDEVPA